MYDTLENQNYFYLMNSSRFEHVWSRAYDINPRFGEEWGTVEAWSSRKKRIISIFRMILWVTLAAAALLLLVQTKPIPYYCYTRFTCSHFFFNRLALPLPVRTRWKKKSKEKQRSGISTLKLRSGGSVYSFTHLVVPFWQIHLESTRFNEIVQRIYNCTENGHSDAALQWIH